MNLSLLFLFLSILYLAASIYYAVHVWGQYREDRKRDRERKREGKRKFEEYLRSLKEENEDETHG